MFKISALTSFVTFLSCLLGWFWFLRMFHTSPIWGASFKGGRSSEYLCTWKTAPRSAWVPVLGWRITHLMLRFDVEELMLTYLICTDCGCCILSDKNSWNKYLHLLLNTQNVKRQSIHSANVVLVSDLLLQVMYLNHFMAVLTFKLHFTAVDVYDCGHLSWFTGIIFYKILFYLFCPYLSTTKSLQTIITSGLLYILNQIVAAVNAVVCKILLSKKKTKYVFS